MKKYENLMSIELTEYEYDYVYDYVCDDECKLRNTTEYKEYAKSQIYSKILIVFKKNDINVSDFFHIISELNYSLYEKIYCCYIDEDENDNEHTLNLYSDSKDCFEDLCKIFKKYKIEIYQFIIDKNDY